MISFTYTSTLSTPFTNQVVFFSGGIPQPPVIVTMTPPQNSYGASVDIGSVSGVQVLDNAGGLLAQCNPLPPDTPTQMTGPNGQLVQFWVTWNPSASIIVVMDDRTDKGSGGASVHHVSLAQETAALLKELFSTVKKSRTGVANDGVKA